MVGNLEVGWLSGNSLALKVLHLRTFCTEARLLLEISDEHAQAATATWQRAEGVTRLLAACPNSSFQEEAQRVCCIQRGEAS